MPDKVEDALIDTLIITGCDHLWVVVELAMTLRIALVLDGTLVAVLWITETLVTLVIDDLVANAVWVSIGPDIEDTAAEVLENAEVLKVAKVRDGVKLARLA